MSATKHTIPNVAPILIDRHLSRQLTVKLSLSDVNVTLASDHEPETNLPVVHLGWGGSNWELKQGYSDIESLVADIAGDEKEVCFYLRYQIFYIADVMCSAGLVAL